MVPSSSGRKFVKDIPAFLLQYFCVALLRDDAGQGEDTKIDIDGAESQMQMLEQQVCLVIF
jgi:hypothetical protein